MDVVISVGGSIVVPGEVDTEFLKKFKDLILEFKQKGKVILIVGGGSTARRYIEAGKNIAEISQDDMDWIGIKSTALNAELVRAVFGSDAYDKVVTDPTKKIETDKIIIGCGWKPGWSTDYVSVLLAESNNVSTVINLTNVDHVYDKNPKEFEDAKPFDELSWKEMKEIVGEEFTPGLNAPFDPVATKLAAALKLKVVIMDGTKIDNLKAYLNGEKFVGTTISTRQV